MKLAEQQTPAPENEDSQAIRVWFRLLRLQTRLHLAMTERLRGLGLSVAQCDVLTTLTEREGVSQRELAERLYVTKGNISGLVDRLVAADLVERRSIAGDRRSHAIFLTSAGRSAAESGIAIQRGFVMETIARLGPQKIGELETLLIGLRDLAREAGERRVGARLAEFGHGEDGGA